MAKPLPPGHLLTPEVRLSFPALFKPKAKFKGDTSGELTYQATLLIPPNTNLSLFIEAMKAAIFTKWEKNITIPAKNNPIHDCAEKAQFEGYDEGWHFIACHSKRPVGVVDRNGVPVSDADAVYPGMWIKAYINAYAWDHPAKGKGVSFGLNGVQLVRDGDRFGAKAVDVTEVFEPLGPAPGGDTGGLDASLFK